MTAKTIFEQANFNFADSVEAENKLSKLDVDELWNIVDQFIARPIEVKGNLDQQNLALKYALMNALDNDAEAITQDDINQAFSKVQHLDSELDIPEPEDIKTVVKVNDRPSVQAKNKTRRVSAYPQVKVLVSENSDLTKNDMVEKILDSFPSLSKMTAVQYYYKARKDLSLSVNGSRGRPNNNTMDKVSALVNKMMKEGAEPLTIRTAISKDFGLTDKTAMVYFYKAKKLLSSNTGE